MPIGGPNFQANTSSTASINGPLIGGSAQVAANVQSSGIQGSVGYVAPMLLILVAAYLIWAVIVQHERLQESLRPANLAVNIHNFINVGLMAAIFLVVGKILSAKLVLWKIPGAGTVAQFFMAT